MALIIYAIFFGILFNLIDETVLSSTSPEFKLVVKNIFMTGSIKTDLC